MFHHHEGGDHRNHFSFISLYEHMSAVSVLGPPGLRLHPDQLGDVSSTSSASELTDTGFVHTHTVPGQLHHNERSFSGFLKGDGVVCGALLAPISPWSLQQLERGMLQCCCWSALKRFRQNSAGGAALSNIQSGLVLMRTSCSVSEQQR